MLVIHVGTSGNEQANKITKTALAKPSFQILSHTDLNSFNKWQQHWDLQIQNELHCLY